MNNNYLTIANHYNSCFEKHGATPKGLDWDNRTNMDRRHKVMLEFIQSKPDQNGRRESVLDFGCGYGDFYNFYFKNFPKSFYYSGIDINKNLIEEAKKIIPKGEFYCEDISNDLNNSYFTWSKNWDYCIMNGLFTVKGELSQDEMSKFVCDTLEKIWPKVNKGLAFNLMSTLVDWKRSDLYHVSMDQICQYLVDNFSRNFVIRNDYGLYEYTIYLYK